MKADGTLGSSFGVFVAAAGVGAALARLGLLPLLFLRLLLAAVVDDVVDVGAVVVVDVVAVNVVVVAVVFMQVLVVVVVLAGVAVFFIVVVVATSTSCNSFCLVLTGKGGRLWPSSHVKVRLG